MSATDALPFEAELPATRTQLRSGTLSPLESLSQSIANIAPTLTPALNITVVVGLAECDLVVYLLVCIVAPIDLYKHGELAAKNVVYSVVGVALMLFVIWGSLYPAPDYPLNLMPYIFAVYMLIGAAWFLYLKRTAPQELLNIEHDLEG